MRAPQRSFRVVHLRVHIVLFQGFWFQEPSLARSKPYSSNEDYMDVILTQVSVQQVATGFVA